MLVRGKIFTARGMGAELWARAMAVKDGVITAVGTEAEAAAAAGPGAQVLDVTDGVVLPAFVDGHAHLLLNGQYLTRVGLRRCKTLVQIQDELLRFRKANPQAKRVLGVSYVFAALPNLTPHRKYLDEIIPDIPVYIDANDLHSVWCNTAALAELGITNDTPDPVGGTIVRDADGAATGYLLENAGFNVAWPVMNKCTDEDDDRYVRTAVDAYLESGTTAAVDMLMTEQYLAALLRADARGQLPLTVLCHWLIVRTNDPASELAQVQRAAELKALHATGRVQVVGVKFLTDGTIDGCTAGVCEPYTNGKPGEVVWPREALEPAVLAADEAGLQVAMHAIGDQAVRTALDVLEVAKARREARGDHREPRHRIEHLEYVAEQDVPRLAALGVTASMQPVHCDPAFLGNWIACLGLQRAQRGFAWPEYLEHGTRLAFGTDTPTADHQALPCMYIAATRCSPYDAEAEPLRPDFSLPLDVSIIHGTRESAWSCFQEHRRGQLAPGLVADFIVLDRDPFTLGPDSLLDTRVLTTFIDGKVAYQRPQ